MKKTLIAVAAVLATSAYAQSSVEVYGRMDLGIASTKETKGTTVTKTTKTAVEDTNTTSRLGFRGTEDLGGGLKASFVIETGLTSNLANRQANLALSSNFGTVTLGKYYNTFDDVLTGAGIGASIVTLSAMPLQTTNGIAYKSPEFGGFTFGAAFGQVKKTVTGAADENDRTRELSVTYSSGPLSVMAAHGVNKAVSSTVIDVEEKAYTAANGKLSGTALQVSYDLGVAVPYLIYSKDEAKSGEFKDGNTVLAQTASLKNSGYEIGATFPMGAFTPFVTYAKSSQKLALNGVQQGNKAKQSGHQVGVTYDLSKRTQMYAVVGSKKWKDAGVTPLKTKQTAVGLVHHF